MLRNNGEDSAVVMQRCRQVDEDWWCRARWRFARMKDKRRVKHDETIF